MNLKKHGPLALFSLVFLIQAYRLFTLIHGHSVNLLTGDDFDDRSPLFKEASTFWELFRYQWGPRRLGLGLPLIKFIQDLSAWNVRTLSFAMGTLLTACVPLVLFIKYRLSKKIVWSDALIPLLILNLHQWELLLFIPLNGIPMLVLVLAAALTLTFEWSFKRNLLLWALGFLLLHTAYGIVGIVPLGLYYLKELFDPRHRKSAFLWGAAHFASFLFFIWGYRSEPGVSCFSFPHPRPWEYLSFQALSQSFFFGFFKTTGLAATIAAFLFLTSYALGGNLLWKPLSPLRRLCLFLLFFSLSYQLNAAVGRVCIDVGAGKLSRYVTFHIPEMLAILFFVQAELRDRTRNFALGAFSLLLVFSAVYFDRREAAIFDELSGGRRRFSECYKRNRDIDLCAQETGFKIYPDQDDPLFLERLEYLKTHKLNFFAEP